jgi:hypothetical protein
LLRNEATEASAALAQDFDIVKNPNRIFGALCMRILTSKFTAAFMNEKSSPDNDADDENKYNLYQSYANPLPSPYNQSSSENSKVSASQYVL